MTTLQQWKNVKPNDIVTLKDEQTILAAMDAGEVINGEDHRVDTVYRFNSDDIHWIFITLEDSNLVVVIKHVDDVYDGIVCFKPDAFIPGNRSDLLKNGSEWYIDPEDLHKDVPYSEMNVTSSLTDGDEVVYESEHGAYWGTMRHDGEDWVAFVKELFATEACDNPYMLFFEYGKDELVEGDGGYVQMFQGVQVNDKDIELNMN